MRTKKSKLCKPLHWVLALIVAFLLFAPYVERVSAHGHIRCRVSFGSLTVNATKITRSTVITVSTGDILTTKFIVEANVGDWDVLVLMSAEHDNIKIPDNPKHWSIAEGNSKTITTRVQVGVSAVVPQGKYLVRLSAISNAENCKPPDSEIEFLRFTVQVQPEAQLPLMEPVKTIDPLADIFVKTTGTAAAVSGIGPIDVTQVEVNLSNNTLSFTLTVNEPLPLVVEETTKRIGCYIDVNGDAAFQPPFRPENFEFLVSWLSSGPPFKSFDVLGSNVGNREFTSTTAEDHLSVTLEIEALDETMTIRWLCFSEFVISDDLSIVDIVPNEGVGVL